MDLDLTSLRKAVASLESSLRVLDADSTSKLDAATREVIRAGVIQSFEFTYELSHKMLKRYLEMTSPTPGNVEEMPFQDLVRTGSEQGLLRGGWDVWKGYRAVRGKTSHTYDEGKAKAVLAAIPAFMAEATHLLEELERRNRASG